VSVLDSTTNGTTFLVTGNYVSSASCRSDVNRWPFVDTELNDDDETVIQTM